MYRLERQQSWVFQKLSSDLFEEMGNGGNAQKYKKSSW
jgi:hypothetical protein